jgi:leader peptidase (prepilin peptidase) / N-methyltransferase
MDMWANILVTATWVWFILTGLTLAVWDIREHRLPNPIVASALLGAVVGFGCVAALSGAWSSLARGLLAAVIVSAVYLVIHILGGMGMGDVKYALVTGLYLGWIGWEALWWGTFIAFLLASMVVLARVLIKLKSPQLPFGPFMAIGVLMAAVIGTSQ